MHCHQVYSGQNATAWKGHNKLFWSSNNGAGLRSVMWTVQKSFVKTRAPIAYANHFLIWSFTSVEFSSNYGFFIFRCFCLLIPQIIKKGRIVEREKGTLAEGRIIDTVFLGEGQEGEKRLRAVELHFPSTQLSLSVAEELTLGPKQYSTQAERMGKKQLFRWLK